MHTSKAPGGGGRKISNRFGKHALLLPSCILLAFLPAQGCTESKPREAHRSLEGYSLTVGAGDYARVNVPVSVPLPAGVLHVRLVETTGTLEKPVPSQIEAGEKPRLHWILDGETPAGTERRYRIVPQEEREAIASEPVVSVLDHEGKSFELRLRSRKALQYNYGMVQPPDPEVPEIQARSAYIHPVWTPSGRVITDDYSPGHLHQRGIWFAWTRTEFEGRHPDFWNLGDGTGAVRFAGTERTTSGPVFGGFKVHHNHVDLSAPGGEMKVLDEAWDLKLYSVGGGDAGFFLFDLSSVQNCAGPSPLKLLEYRYGGLAFRGSSQWSHDREEYLTSEGRTKENGDRSSAVWCKNYGEIDGRNAGIVVFSHPQNYRSPQPLRIYPGEPYFCWAPVQKGEMSIQPGEPYISRYRFLVFDGELTKDRIDDFWKDYAEPPLVTMDTEP